MGSMECIISTAIMACITLSCCVVTEATCIWRIWRTFGTIHTLISPGWLEAFPSIFFIFAHIKLWNLVSVSLQSMLFILICISSTGSAVQLRTLHEIAWQFLYIMNETVPTIKGSRYCAIYVKYCQQYEKIKFRAKLLEV